MMDIFVKKKIQFQNIILHPQKYTLCGVVFALVELLLYFYSNRRLLVEELFQNG